jgi:hypothetical protein
LRASEISTGRDVLLASRSAEYSYSPVWNSSISNAAATVLYVVAPQSGQPSQVWTIHPDGTGRRQLTNFLQDVSEAVISATAKPPSPRRMAAWSRSTSPPAPCAN